VRGVVLKSGHVQPVWAGHPWIYAQGVEKTFGNPEPGDDVVVLDQRGNQLGRGFYSPRSAIVVRLYSRDPAQEFDEEFLATKLARAELERTRLLSAEGPEATTSYRLVYGEGDGLPGLIVDRFQNALVVQLGTVGLARRRDLIVRALMKAFSPETILDRTSERLAKSEGFDLGTPLLSGKSPEELVALERDLEFRLPMSVTQKTGFYFDQRPLRARIEALARGRDVLDAYSYVGAVGLFARRGGARRVLCVDSSVPAINAGRKLSEQSGLDVEYVAADAEKVLEGQRDTFDIVVADPPKFAYSRSMQNKAMRAFRRVASLAAQATRSGGIVALSSCSAALGVLEVERSLALGAADVGRRARVFERVFQGPDHPVPSAFPEGFYLSSVLAWVE
jgi:23S rRNA (cytosine1962-C5)-methyltransferase